MSKHRLGIHLQYASFSMSKCFGKWQNLTRNERKLFQLNLYVTFFNVSSIWPTCIESHWKQQHAWCCMLKHYPLKGLVSLNANSNGRPEPLSLFYFLFFLEKDFLNDSKGERALCCNGRSACVELSLLRKAALLEWAEWIGSTIPWVTMKSV